MIVAKILQLLLFHAIEHRPLGEHRLLGEYRPLGEHRLLGDRDFKVLLSESAWND